jgi:hypothetical protein
MAWNKYFELRWGLTPPSTYAYTRRFHMMMGADHLGQLNWSTIMRSLDAGAIRVQTPATKRVIEGTLLFYTLDGIAEPYGTYAELVTGLAATDLQCKGFDDAAYWNAIHLPNGQIAPEHWDPQGKVLAVRVRLEEK